MGHNPMVNIKFNENIDVYTLITTAIKNDSVFEKRKRKMTMKIDNDADLI